MADATNAAAATGSAAAPPPASNDSAAAAAAAAQSDLSAPDAILEPMVLITLSSYMSATGGGAKSAKRAIRMLSDGYKGRGDMLRLLGEWSQTAGVGSAAALDGSLQRLVQRAVAQRFDGAVADQVLSQAQPAWLDAIVANPSWEAPLLALAEKAPSSVFLRLCVSLMSEHRREHAQDHAAGVGTKGAAGGDAGAQSGGAGGAAGSATAGISTALNASVRAGALQHVEQFHSSLDALLHAIIAKSIERAARKRKRAAGNTPPPDAPVKLETAPSEFAGRVAALELESLLQDFLRLSAQSEWTYLYAQRLLQSVAVSAPRACGYVLRRLSQDLTEQAAHPPAAPVSLLQSAAAVAAASATPLHNTSVYPLDLMLAGVRPEWNDVVQVLLVLGRTGTLAALDIAKLYARYAPAAATAAGAGVSVDPPPASLLRNKALIRVLIEALFSSNSQLHGGISGGGGVGGGEGPGAGSRVSDRYKYAYLLAYACTVVDDRVGCVQLCRRIAEVEAANSGAHSANDAASAAAAAALHASSTPPAAASSSSPGVLDKSGLDATLPALLQLHDLASSKTWGVRPYTLLRCVHSSIPSSPLLAAAAVFFVSTQLCEVGFYDTTYHTTVTPFLLNLLGEICNRHALLRGQVFGLVARALELSPPSVDGFVLIQLRKLLLNLLLHLVHCGHNLGEVMSLVGGEVPRGMDHSLVRHFVVGLLHSTGPPYSRMFLTHVLRILALPQTYKALQNSLAAGAEAKRLLAGEMSAAAAASPANTAVAHFLAQAHVAPNTPAAKRLLAAAEKHGHLPVGSSLAPEAALSAEEEAAEQAHAAAADAADADADADAGEGAQVKAEDGSDEPAPKKTKVESESSSTITLIPGTKAARREEKERLRRAVAEAEQRRRAEALKRLLHTANAPREPRPLTQLSHGPDVRDGSETAVLDFCLLLHTEPDLIRLSPTVVGLQLDSDGAVVADQCDFNSSATGAIVPVDSHTMQQYMQTLKQYLDTQEKMP